MSMLTPQLGLWAAPESGSQVSLTGPDPLLRVGDGAGTVYSPQTCAAWLHGRSGVSFLSGKER